jgi:carbon monoxide dehydrogenase subunit G
MSSSPSPRPTHPSESPATEPLLVFVHIQKTAGKTLRQIFYRQYTRGRTRLVRNYFVAPEVSRKIVESLAADPPADLRVIHGHILFWPDIQWPEGTQFLTMLRDPVERAISHYFWLRERSSRFRKTLEEALTSGSIPDNLQTRVLAARMPKFNDPTGDMLEDALRSVKRLTVVGLTERFDESFVLATRRLGWRRMIYRKENVTAGRKPQERISPKVLDLIKRYNALDLELYRSASKRFEREVEAEGEGFDIEVAALQRANERVAGLPDDAPLPPLASTIMGTDGIRIDDLDLRELLVEAQAELLQRDAAIEYLTGVSSPRGARAIASRTRKRANTVDGRKAALDEAIKRAASRLENLRKQIRAIEKEGAAGSQLAKLEALKQSEATTAKRLEGFQRRSGKLANELQNGEAETASVQDDEGAADQPPRVESRYRPKKVRRRAAQDPGEEHDSDDPKRTAQVDGTRRFAASPDIVWDVLDRPDRFSKLIPAIESIEIIDEDRWTASVNVPFRRDSRLVLECEKSEQRRPEHARLTVRGKGGGAAVTIDGVFDLAEGETGTEMTWETEVDLTGAVGPMRPRVLQLLVRKQMKNLLAALEREVQQESTVAAGDGA